MYSKELQEETKKAFLDFDNSDLSFLDVVCMKNFDDRFGLIQKNNIIHSNFEIYDRVNKTVLKYTSIDDLIIDGWVVD